MFRSAPKLYTPTNKSSNPPPPSARPASSSLEANTRTPFASLPPNTVASAGAEQETEEGSSDVEFGESQILRNAEDYARRRKEERERDFLAEERERKEAGESRKRVREVEQEEDEEADARALDSALKRPNLGGLTSSSSASCAVSTSSAGPSRRKAQQEVIEVGESSEVEIDEPKEPTASADKGKGKEKAPSSTPTVEAAAATASSPALTVHASLIPSNPTLHPRFDFSLPSNLGNVLRTFNLGHYFTHAEESAYDILGLSTPAQRESNKKKKTEFVLSFPEVEEYHVAFHLNKNSGNGQEIMVWMEDLSKNGLWLNGELAAHEALLFDGDVLHFGASGASATTPSQYTFRSPAPPPSPAGLPLPHPRGLQNFLKLYGVCKEPVPRRAVDQPWTEEEDRILRDGFRLGKGLMVGSELGTGDAGVACRWEDMKDEWVKKGLVPYGFSPSFSTAHYRTPTTPRTTNAPSSSSTPPPRPWLAVDDATLRRMAVKKCLLSDIARVLWRREEELDERWAEKEGEWREKGVLPGRGAYVPSAEADAATAEAAARASGSSSSSWPVSLNGTSNGRRPVAPSSPSSSSAADRPAPTASASTSSSFPAALNMPNAGCALAKSSSLSKSTSAYTTSSSSPPSSGSSTKRVYSISPLRKNEDERALQQATSTTSGLPTSSTTASSTHAASRLYAEYPNDGSIWTREHDETLRKGRVAGKTFADLAKELGRTERALRTRWYANKNRWVHEGSLPPAFGPQKTVAASTARPSAQASPASSVHTTSSRIIDQPAPAASLHVPRPTAPLLPLPCSTASAQSPRSVPPVLGSLHSSRPSAKAAPLLSFSSSRTATCAPGQQQQQPRRSQLTDSAPVVERGRATTERGQEKENDLSGVAGRPVDSSCILPPTPASVVRLSASTIPSSSSPLRFPTSRSSVSGTAAQQPERPSPPSTPPARPAPLGLEDSSAAKRRRLASEQEKGKERQEEELEEEDGKRPLSSCCHCVSRPPPRALSVEEQEQARKKVAARSKAWERARRGMGAFLQTFEGEEREESD